MKVLLVEDNPTLADVSCRLLREVHEHEVESAGSGTEALAKLKHFTPDVALLDIHLPDISGYELATRIRQQRRFDGTVLVALTGMGTLLAGAEQDAAGFDVHFRKPMDFDLLPTLRRRV